MRGSNNNSSKQAVVPSTRNHEEWDEVVGLNISRRSANYIVEQLSKDAIGQCERLRIGLVLSQFDDEQTLLSEYNQLWEGQATLDEVRSLALTDTLSEKQVKTQLAIINAYQQLTMAFHNHGRPDDGFYSKAKENEYGQKAAELWQQVVAEKEEIASAPIVEQSTGDFLDQVYDDEKLSQELMIELGKYRGFPPYVRLASLQNWAEDHKIFAAEEIPTNYDYINWLKVMSTLDR